MLLHILIRLKKLKKEDADLYESNYIEKITDDILKKLTINGQIKSI